MFPFLSVVLTGLSTPAFAQSVDPVLLDAPEPLYPHGATGEAEVRVEVRVGTRGEVLEAVPVSGPAVFRAAASEAATHLLYAPATLDGEPVIAGSSITFHFEPPEQPHTHEDADYEIVVRARSETSEDPHARAVVEGIELQRTRGLDLAHSVARIPGVTVAQGTADASKPIIRGQYERRLLVLNDGIRLESQKWGRDHATEIDPFSAGRIEVIKGAAGVRYGPDAIGGVLLVEPRSMRSEAGLDGELQLVGVSNGRGGTGALRIDAAPKLIPGLSLRIEGNLGLRAAVSTPDYVLGNTGSRRWNLGVRAQYQRGATTFTASVHHYDLRAGICYCVHNGSVQDFEAQLLASKPIGSDTWKTQLGIDRPYQAVRHDQAMARMTTDLGGSELKATYAFQLNRRTEAEQVRGSVTGPQYDFTLRTHSIDLLLTHDAWSLGPRLSLSGAIGATSSFQENVYTGLPLIPNHRAFTGGLHGYARLKAPRVDLELGGRVDRQSRSSFLDAASFARHQARGTLDTNACEQQAHAARCDRRFQTGSLSAGALWHGPKDRLELKLQLSSASRFPNGDELYMNGGTPTSPVYGLGDPSLRTETTWGGSSTMGLRLEELEGEASVYANTIDRFVVFSPDIGPDGQPSYDITVRGAFPRFTFHAVNALFYGFDGGLVLGPNWPLSIRAHGSVVRARDRQSGAWLPFIPPDRVQISARGQLPDVGSLSESFVELSGEQIAQQTHFTPATDLTPPPQGTFLLSAGIGTQMLLRHHRVLTIGLEGTNLLNRRYRTFNSLLRYYADQPGRSLRLRLGFTF